MPIYEFVCTTTECPENTGHVSTNTHRTIELFCRSDEEPECKVCGHQLIKLLSAIPGRVYNSSTPCKV